jgi:hypothetical protein
VEELPNMRRLVDLEVGFIVSRYLNTVVLVVEAIANSAS